MKYTLIAVTAFVFATSSCHRNLSITLDEVPTERIRGEQCLRIDSCSIANIFLYGDYVVGIVPQSNWGRHPYYLFDKSHLNIMGEMGVFGHSGDEFTNVNPYYVEVSNSGFVQCVDGCYEGNYTIEDGKLLTLGKQKISACNMNGLCRLDSTTYLFRSEGTDEEYAVYSSAAKKITTFGRYPQDVFPVDNAEDEWGYYSTYPVFNVHDNILYSFHTYIPLVRLYAKGREEMASYITDGSISASANYQAYQNDTSPIFYGIAKSYGRSIYALYHGTRFLQPYSEIQVWQDRGRLVKRYVIDKWIKCFDIDVSSDVLYGIYVDDEEYIFSASLSYI